MIRMESAANPAKHPPVAVEEPQAKCDYISLNEDKLQEAKRLSELAAIVESSDDVILSKDLNGIITSWNAAATRVFGYTPEEIIGKSILTLIPDHLHSDEKTIIESIRAGRRVQHFETVRRTKSGDLIDVSLTVSPVRDANGDIVGASKILRDISERRRMEQSLIQAEKIAATGRMAATIAHEINNPLEAITNLLYLLRPMIADIEGIKYLAAAEEELARVSSIAKQTLGYYRESSSAKLISLSDIVNDAITIYGPRCRVAEINVHSCLESERQITIRRGEIMQVISNIVANAIYAMPSGGALSISTSDIENPPGVSLKISDTGNGIKEQDLPRIFEAFFTTRATIGTGIGLFIAKQFIEAHGGEITIASQTEGANHGTEVSIFLPLHTKYEDERPPAED